MAREPRDGGADVAAVFEAGLSGYHPSPYLTADDLRALSERCVTADRVICNIEAYEIDGECDYARLDLSLHGESAEMKALPWAERAEASRRFVAELLNDVRAEKNPIMFMVWIDRAN